MKEKISADPTKDFFISMLTRDISLLSSIIDLVDNSVDAALVTGGYQGKGVDIVLSKDVFHVVDNCGGIELAAARGYAFKFGRPTDAPLTPHTVGRFGVGMKRALFKIGSNFSVISHHSDSSFMVKVDVNTWIEEGGWTFDMETIEPIDNKGTKISVENLHQSVSDNFSDGVFIALLIETIEKAHFKIIKDGFNITVNGIDVGLSDIQIYSSGEIGLSGREVNYDGVSVVIKAGIGERDYHAGGWNILCNNRLIEVANKGALTGWGRDGIRAYHPDFAFFRGVVEFSSEDGSNLPWNTTKTGIDTDNVVYRSTLVVMRNVMRPVLELLKDRAKEKENSDRDLIDETPIADAIDDSGQASIFDVKVPDRYVRPTLEVVAREITHRRISYSVGDDIFQEVKDSLGAGSNKKVGELTFNYYVDNEI